MSKRLTFVGIAKCGCAQYLAQDPATYSFDIENIADEYKSLIDDLRHYARTGSIKLVTDDELKPYTDQMTSCTHKEAA